MIGYFGNDTSSYQQVGGYYYQPYVDNGTYAKMLKEAGAVAGEGALGFVGGAAGEALGGGKRAGALGATVGALIGHYAGGSAGDAAGFYVDNLTRMMENMNTFLSELNDPNSWIIPTPLDQ
jgi:hypothetical protein